MKVAGMATHPAQQAQHGTAQAEHGTAQHSTASTAQHSTAQHSTAQHSTAQHSRHSRHSTAARHSTTANPAQDAKHGMALHSTAANPAQHGTAPGMLSRGLAQHRGFQLEVCQLLLVLLYQGLRRHTLCMLLPQFLPANTALPDEQAASCQWLLTGTKTQALKLLF